jgi:hypothetical protein
MAKADLWRMQASHLPQVVIEIIRNCLQILEKEHEHVHLIKLSWHVWVHSIHYLHLCNVQQPMLVAKSHQP